MLGYHYWGGSDDIQEDLVEHGHPTLTASVGPVSSNWDRACELYAQLRGGQVDYGAAHAKEHRHNRLGTTYPSPLFALWGKPLNGKPRAIHLLTHSQGGQTARVLAHLLVNGASEELGAGDEPSTLFEGGKRWIRSITTLSTPHDGTTLTHVMIDTLPFIQKLLGGIAALAGITPNAPVFDFKLGHFGLSRHPDETIADYWARASSSAILQTRDSAMWDLSPEGAKALNARYPAVKGLYYFSWATEATSSDSIDGIARPEASMFLMFQLQATQIGRYTSDKAGQVTINERWFQNDGVVNTNSMDGPSLGTSVAIVPFSGHVRPGMWNYMGLLNSTDHVDIVGIGTGEDVRPWYRRWANFLRRLPQ
jgi:triacylglycerol lipase